MTDYFDNKEPNTYVKNGFRFSILLHVLFGLWLVAHWVVQTVTPPTEAEKKLRQPKKSIRVDVVDLPSLRLDELYKVDLTKEASPNARLPEDKPKEVVPPPPTPKTMKLPEVLKEAKKPEEPKPDLSHPKDAKDAKKARIAELQKSFRNEAKRQEVFAKYKKEVQASDEDKRPILGGNIISKGGSVQGGVANDADEFTASVQSHVRKFWKAPPWAAGRDLKVQVAVKISPAGRVLSKQVIKSSGRPEFDASAIEAVEAADPFPAPPEQFKRIVLQEGIVCGFPE